MDVRILSSHLEKMEHGASPAPKETSPLQKKKEQGEKPCSKNCVDPISPKNWI
jgi:hypothetical protein